MKYQYCYENKYDFFGSLEYDEFEKTIKKEEVKKYKDQKIIIDYKYCKIMINEIYINLSELLNVDIKEDKILISYTFLFENKEAFVKRNEKLYKELISIISIKNNYYNKYLEKSERWNKKYKTYLYLFLCDYKELFLELDNKEQEEIAKNVSLIKESNIIFLKYIDKKYLLKKCIGDSVEDDDFEKVEFCYINISEYNDNYMFSLKLCKEK